MEEQTKQPFNADEFLAEQQKLTLEAKARNGVNWFYWIAGLSLVNSIIFFAGASVTFVVGLGITQLIDGVALGVAEQLPSNSGSIVRIIGLVINLFVAGFFAGAGLLGRKGHRWAVIVGMVLYALDAILFILFKDWLPVAFHALALWGLWGGLKALLDLKKLKQESIISTSAFQGLGS